MKTVSSFEMAQLAEALVSELTSANGRPLAYVPDNVRVPLEALRQALISWQVPS